MMDVMLASGLTAAFLTAGLSAWRLLRTGIVIAAVFAPLQIAAGFVRGPCAR